VRSVSMFIAKQELLRNRKSSAAVIHATTVSRNRRSRTVEKLFFGCRRQ
jgi:hypothetical protein